MPCHGEGSRYANSRKPLSRVTSSDGLFEEGERKIISDLARAVAERTVTARDVSDVGQFISFSQAALVNVGIQGGSHSLLEHRAIEVFRVRWQFGIEIARPLVRVRHGPASRWHAALVVEVVTKIVRAAHSEVPTIG